MDYCSKPEEVAQNPNALGLMVLIANGNADAFDFIWRCWNFCHLLDDLIDKDKPVTITETARELFLFTQTIAINPFFQLNTASLLPMILNACNGWVAGEEANGKEYAPAIKCSDFNIYSHVAFLVGGWEHMRYVDSKFRIYDKE
jgi:hypothetical protein